MQRGCCEATIEPAQAMQRAIIDRLFILKSTAEQGDDSRAQQSQVESINRLLFASDGKALAAGTINADQRGIVVCDYFTNGDTVPGERPFCQVRCRRKKLLTSIPLVSQFDLPQKPRTLQTWDSRDGLPKPKRAIFAACHSGES